MSMILPDVMFEYVSGDTTSVVVGHCTDWRTVPAAVCVSPVNSCSLIEIEGAVPYYLRAPDSFIIPRDVRHCITIVESDNPVSIWCHVNINVFHGLDLLSFYDIPRALRGDSSDVFRQAILNLNALNASGPVFEQAFLRQYHGFTLVNAALNVSSIKSDAAQRFAAYSRIAPALEFMRRHLDRNVMLSELADCVNLSPSRFSALFREVAGEAPVAYFNRLRIVRARELLLRGGFSVGEIAVQLGFFDAYHFSHKFKQLIGVSPKEYRQTILRGL